MQLDHTRIAIRERGLLETVDLALLVMRDFAGPILWMSLLGVLPLALINYALIGWMAPNEYDGEVIGFRFLWNMSVLIYLEAPLAGAFVVAFLGPAVFLEQRTARQVVSDVFRQFIPLLLTQGLLRGVLLAWLLYLFTDRLEVNGFIEGFGMFVLCGWAAAVRSFRPYINEIILLEKNPLWPRPGTPITIGKRSSHLHSPYSGDLLVRSFGTTGIAALLVGLMLFTAIVTEGFLISDWPIHFSAEDSSMAWNLDWFKLQFVYPACLWMVVIFMSVVRFLGYLDLRIRHEGWEVELQMRAEALRLELQMT